MELSQLRVEWTYGFGGNNFITKLVSSAKQQKQLTIVDDQVGSPTATTEVAGVICKLPAQKPQGLFHFANSGYAGRFEVAGFIFENLDMPVNLRSCKTSDYKTKAKRPLNSRFDCSKIKSLLGEDIRPWQEPLKSFLRQL